MATDILDYWRGVAPSARIHPDDQDMLSRIGHGFDLRCLPGQLAGLLPTAPIVLLFLSGGLSKEYDLTMAESEVRIEEHRKRRLGLLPLWAPDEHRDAWTWWTKLTRCFDPDWQALRSRVAIVDIGAYKSKEVSGRDRKLLERLPSSRVVREWARDTLFPQAMNGERVVVVLRSQVLWGLAQGKRYGVGLFAPNVTRGGHMFHEPLRDEVIAVAREFLTKSRSLR